MVLIKRMSVLHPATGTFFHPGIRIPDTAPVHLIIFTTSCHKAGALYRQAFNLRYQ